LRIRGWGIEEHASSGLEVLTMAIFPLRLLGDCSMGRSRTYQTVVERHFDGVVVASRVYKLMLWCGGVVRNRTRLSTLRLRKYS
jgi:hypothetical protein